MKARFEGPDGHRRLCDCLLDQHILRGHPSVANALAEVVSIREHAPGEVLITQGTDENDVAFILSGALEVLINGNVVAQRPSGTHIGEMSAIDPKARRSATVRAVETTLAAWVAEPQLAAVANTHPELWRNFAKVLADRLRERDRFHPKPNPRPRVFIGSSVEGLELPRKLQLEMDHDDVDIVPWTERTFRPSNYTVDDLLSQVKRCDFALFVLAPDDSVTSRNVTTAAPRDNTIFELGLFMGVLGRERTLVLKPRGQNVKVPSDLFGLTPIEYKPTESPEEMSVGAVCQQIRSVIRRLGVR
ncbi:TIR domain-containing protein [Archangium sp.]|uniref:TIR domain-containing protein n=1 Tax=Archangium sp. TaxID=1872627 RepID=UPI003899DE15